MAAVVPSTTRVTPGDRVPPTTEDRIRHAERARQVMDLCRLEFLRSLSPRDVVSLARVDRASFRSFAPLLPLFGWHPPPGAPASQAVPYYEVDLAVRLGARSSATRRDAQLFLARWCADMPPVLQGFAESRAVRLLESLPAYAPTLERQVGPDGAARHRIRLPEALKQLVLSPDARASRMGQTIVAHYVDLGQTTTSELLHANDAVPVLLAEDDRPVINELCRDSFWLGTPAQRHLQVRQILRHVQFEAGNSEPALVAAVARFLRDDPDRDRPEFVDVLVAVMSQPPEAGLEALSTPAFAEALVRPEPADPGDPHSPMRAGCREDIVRLAFARATPLP